MSERALKMLVGMPGYGCMSPAAGRGFWRATRLPDDVVVRQYQQGSLLAANFNKLWCAALNRKPAIFAMQHDDIGPDDWWVDVLAAEMEAHDLDVIGVPIPIKDTRGITSTALARPDGCTWRPLCRLSTTEIQQLPETFTSEDVGYPLLINTGLWACRFKEEWARKVRFTINDRIAIDPDGRYFSEVEPEDWFFSRLLHELGLKVGCTRKVAAQHRGYVDFPNNKPCGQPFDAEALEQSVLAKKGA